MIQTASGAGYDFLNPDPAIISLEDIAHATANICRFAGHVRHFYSVAEHSVLVSKILEAQDYGEPWQRIGLLHDGHEAYVWDAPTPIKPLLGDAFAELAENADIAIGEHFDIAPEYFRSSIVKAADGLALVTEASQLLKHGVKRWRNKPSVDAMPDGVLNQPPWTPEGGLGWGPYTAKIEFLRRAKELGL